MAPKVVDPEELSRLVDVENADKDTKTKAEIRQTMFSRLTSSLSPKLMAFWGLILIQVLVGIVYKVSQTGGKYDYSVSSALSISESVKFCLSSAMLLQQSGSVSAAVQTFRQHSNFRLVSQMFGLAVLYSINNHLGFVLMSLTDPASVALMKSGTAFISAFLLYLFLSRTIVPLQWVAIALQGLGLVVAQYDSCSGKSLTSPSVYLLLFISVMITSISSVWNENIIKTFNAPLNVVNMNLYIFGSILNSFVFSVYSLDGKSLGFFEGYNAGTMSVIFVNSVIGICVTAVYKYADVIVKTLAQAFSTIVLTYISFTFFGLKLNITIACGGLVVILSTYQYMAHAALAGYSVNPPAAAASPADSSKTAQKKKYLLVCGACFLLIGVIVFAWPQLGSTPALRGVSTGTGKN